ncbi:hypothetical protein GCM10009775_25360 [Microbacterium aoyamense]|uniref:Ribosomally synthesized peptide with SipW-like signal peptide n=1 Tax=Microbacterium aoyamense TaxID=344166 RepID=A0ABN2PWV0_9MICO|nr:hypothetical protein [Microbacterium aoyamense]
MSDLTTQPTTRRENRTAAPKKNKRRPIVAFALATLAVGGVGAALTSAAWTDNVFMAAAADGATFDLQASLDNKDWKQSDDKKAVQITVAADKFAKLLPGQTRTVTLYVKNAGNVNAKLVSSVEWAGSTFATNPKAEVGDLAASLAPSGSTGDTDAFTLTVTAPADWDVANKGKSGTIVVTLAGEATS